MGKKDVPPPELHKAVDESQRDEVLAAVLSVVEQQTTELGGTELHGDAHRVVGLYSLEGQIRLATKSRNVVFNS